MSTATDKKKDSAADPPAKAAIEAIEEDDEFEEFEPAHWAAGEEVSEDTQQWQDNWDADDMDDDFTKNLREELMKNSGKEKGSEMFRVVEVLSTYRFHVTSLRWPFSSFSDHTATF